MTDKKDFDVRFELSGKVAKIFVQGPLKEEAGLDLRSIVERKIEEGFTRFVFDFGNSRAMSSPAVATVLDLAEMIVDSKSGKLIISGLTDLNMKVFEMVGIFMYAEACATHMEAEVRALM
ncbi:MAG TPA: hypothetical protein PKO06_21920 [Candidatus Ozemobacteraceae bacterium]|nr:hypothetical protein [Candidatus Ozemobacteraceae bacterium]